MSRNIVSTFLAASLMLASGSAAFAKEGALASGKPAGVKQAQLENSTLFVILGVGILAGGIALAASGGDNSVTPSNTVTNTLTNTSTSTSP